MDNNLKVIISKRIDRTILNLQKHNMNGYHLKDNEELQKKLDELIQDNNTVSVGGSMTLFETGVIDYLRNRDITFLDRYKKELTTDERKKLYRDVFSSDVFLSSTNAVTESGELYNVDGIGNRVAALIYGPEKVIIISGYNKIVKDLDEAKQRNRMISAPANAERLNMDTPCRKTGYCVNCNSSHKICNIYTVIDRQLDPNRIHVIFCDDEYGY
jgi:L-lactate utilization protein LutB